MKLHEFQTAIGRYEGINASGVTQKIDLNPRSYHHLCRFSWQSSNGDLKSLKKVGTRENVAFRTRPDAPPFNHVQSGTPMQFIQGATDNSGADLGYCDDDHSTIVPHLICSEPRAEGSLIAEQWYEYTLDGKAWHKIPEAAYLIEKAVKKRGADWIYIFRKQSWAAHNPNPFKLEIEYKIDAKATFVPIPGKPISKGIPERADLKRIAHKIVSLK